MENLLGYIVARRFQIEKKIGQGSFGEIFQAINLENGIKVGVKVELTEGRYPQLVYESKIYEVLRGGPGIPYMHWFGSELTYNFLVIDLLGLSLEALFEKCGRSFSLKTILQMSVQMISRIEYLHSQCFIHRDIKPENFVIGVGNRKQYIYIIDYGLCKKYLNLRTGEHISYIEGKSLTGTARYVSINTHLGIEQSRRDDLEGLAYVLLYFLKGRLPWQDIVAVEKADRYELIKNIKIQTTVAELCAGLPQEFQVLLEYSRSLEFEEIPDYTYIREIFTNLTYKSKFELDYKFDWDQQNILLAEKNKKIK